MAEIRKAVKEDLPALLSLWKEVFHDDDLFLTPFTEARFDTADVLMVPDGEGCASALWLIPFTAHKVCTFFPAWLLAGAATKEAHRRKGLMSTLIKCAQSRHNDIFLYPEEDKRPFYRSLGFKDCFLPSPTIPEEAQLVEDPDINELNTLYERAYNSQGFIKRDAFAWSTILDSASVFSTSEGFFIKTPKTIEPLPFNGEATEGGVLGGMSYGENLIGFHIIESY